MRNIFKNLLIVPLLAWLLSSPVLASAATLKLAPSSGTVNKGCTLAVNIDLDTQGTQTDGTDVILFYDPAVLSATTSSIKNGTIYSDYPGNSVDSNGKKISISGISSVSAPFSGQGTFATINFTVVGDAGSGASAALKFDFDPNDKSKTTDTNVVERGTIADKLTAVTDANFTVGSGPCSSSVSASNPNSGSNGSTNGTTNSIVGGTGGTLNGTTNTTTSFGGRGGVNDSSSSGNCTTIDCYTGGGKTPGFLDNTILIVASGGTLILLGILGLVLL